MNAALRHVLEELAQETRAFLACLEPDIAAWEQYSERRAALFARLQEMSFQGEGETQAKVAGLVDEILSSDAILLAKAQERLNRVREELHTLRLSRRALRGYALGLPPLLLERSA
jgi:enoyl-CoA hydratase/carnithine racemase